MGGIRVNWAASALAIAAAAAATCLLTALLAANGRLFLASLAAGVGIAAGTVYAALALRDAERRTSKLSDELTLLSQRLLRLENRPTPPETEPAIDVPALMRATSALTEMVRGQDGRLRALETAPASPPPSAPPEVQPDPPPGPPPAPPRIAALAAASPPPALLASREDFARAATAILGRLASDPLHVIETPEDDAVVDGLEEGRLELWLQPVVTLPQRRTRLYETLPHLRARDGRVLGPDAVRSVLARRKRLERLDAMSLIQGLQVATHLASRRSEVRLGLALSRDALGNDAFLAGAASRLEADRPAAARIVFALAHGEAETLSAVEASGLDRLRRLVSGLVITEVPTLDCDWAAFVRRGFTYGTLDVETVLAPRPHATTAFLVAEAARAGLALVATGLAREQQIPDLLDFDVPLARGPALAAARPVRPEILSPKPEPAPVQAPSPSAAAPQASEGRAPFRDFLRRAG